MVQLSTLVVLLLALAAPARAAAPGDTIFASGLPGLAAPTADLFGWNVSGRSEIDDGVSNADASQDGTVVVFATEADDLVSLADRGPSHVVVKNRATGALTVVTAGANSSSSGASISDDGTRVAFASRATNLSASDTTPDMDVFVKDLVSGVVTLVSSPALDPCQDISCAEAEISGNGLHVAFRSRLPLIPANDPNDRGDIYRRTLAGGALELASARNGLSSATTTPFDAFGLSISDDGRFVAFSSSATDLVAGDTPVRDVFVRQLGTTITIRASAVSGSSVPADGDSGRARLSGSGRFLAFSSAATNLPPDADTLDDVFVRTVTDLGITSLVANGATELVSRASGAGANADAAAAAVAINDSGNVVLFGSSATNLGAGAAGFQPYVRNATGSTTTALLTPGTGSAFGAGMSGDGGHALVSANGALVAGAPPSAMYTRPTGGGAAEIVSTRQGAAAAQPQLGDVDQSNIYYRGQPQVLSADGRYLAFATYARALTGLADDTAVFRRDLRTGELVRVSRTDAGVGTQGWSPSISADAGRVAFLTTAALVAADGDANTDAYVLDIPSGQLILASRGGTPDAKADGATRETMISADGRHVLFTVNASNLGAPGIEHAYVRDLAAGTTRLADRAVGDAIVPANAAVDGATISGDGSRVVFATTATNLGDGDADGTRDVHLRDLTAGTTTLVSRQDGAGPKGTSLSLEPVISRDGNRVAFRSYANNLDTSYGTLPPGTETPQTFLRDIAAGTTRLISRVGADGPPSDENTGANALNADGSVVAYQVKRAYEGTRNVAPGVAVDGEAVVVRTIATGAQQVIGITASPDPADTSSARGVATPSLSADGGCITFHARGYGFDPVASPDYWHAWVRVLSGDCGVPSPPPALPGSGPGTGPVTVTPAVAPRITSFSVTNRRFRVGRRATALTSATKRRPAKVGTTFRYRLSKAARVAITIERRTRGRRVGTRCRQATAKLRKRRACVRYVKAGTLRRSGRAGANRLAFSGRLGRKALRVGSYRARIVATDSGGRRSGSRTVLFTVVRR